MLFLLRRLCAAAISVPMQSMKTVFAFDDPVDFLHFHLQEQQRFNTRFSLRQWAREIGYENPSYLSHVLKQERRLKPELAAKLADSMGLSGKARKYFEVSVLKKNSDSDIERTTYEKMMREMRPKRGFPVNKVSIETLSVLSDWIHVAIFEIAALGAFDGTLRFIERKLQGRASKKQVKQAVDRLLRVEMLKRDSFGRLVRASAGPRVLEGGIPSPAIRRLHKQFMELGENALEEQTIEERFNQSSTLAIPEDRLSEAKVVLRDALEKLLGLVNGSKSKDVYQCNVQLFRLTNRDRGVLQ